MRDKRLEAGSASGRLLFYSGGDNVDFWRKSGGGWPDFL
jgi:hypothetical protein